jgi:hypothetical protein
MITAVNSTYYIADTKAEVLTITGTAPLGKVVRCLVNENGAIWKRTVGVWSEDVSSSTSGTSNGYFPSGW